MKNFIQNLTDTGTQIKLENGKKAVIGIKKLDHCVGYEFQNEDIPPKLNLFSSMNEDVILEPGEGFSFLKEGHYLMLPTFFENPRTTADPHKLRRNFFVPFINKDIWNLFEKNDMDPFFDAIDLFTSPRFSTGVSIKIPHEVKAKFETPYELKECGVAALYLGCAPNYLEKGRYDEIKIVLVNCQEKPFTVTRGIKIAELNFFPSSYSYDELFPSVRLENRTF